MARTHPHIEAPTIAQLRDLVRGRPHALQEVYIALHELILEVLPGVRTSVDEVDHVIGYGSKQYGYGGWGMLAVSPFSKWVSLTFMQGARLDDPESALSGSASMRHFKAAKVDDVHASRAVLVALIDSGTRLHSPSQGTT